MAYTFISGSAAVGSGGEFSLTGGASGATPGTSASTGVFQIYIDLGLLAAGDAYRMKLYETVYTGASQRVIDEWYATGPQSEALFTFPPQLLGVGWDATIIKTAGTDRTIYYSLRKIS